MSAKPEILWEPKEDFFKHSRLKEYMVWLSEHSGLNFSDYDELWNWSVGDTGAFWKSIWEYFNIDPGASIDVVHTGDPMPETKWFPGTRVNYAEYIFRKKTDRYPAILFQSERHELKSVSWQDLEIQVARLAGWMQEQGIQKGDRVVAYIPNIPEASIAFLAAVSIGAVWSSCSPDFGSKSVIDRFRQIDPKLFIAVDGYQYNGKAFDKKNDVRRIADQLPSLKNVILIPYLSEKVERFLVQDSSFWGEILVGTHDRIHFNMLEFDDPIWILYSSGTTGIPKAITHSHGGVLLEHLKYLTLQNDVKPGERFFWYSTTGWMMWNFVHGSLLAGASIVLYDGSPAYPSVSVLWELVEKTGINHFGTSAPFLIACMKKSLSPGINFNLSSIRSIGSTGSVLPPEAFDWVYREVGENIWLCSMSGGSDVCTAFVGSAPGEPVCRGEIQRRALGCSLFAYDEMGNIVTGEVGEMVITKAMPSMPVCFWNDPDKVKYLGSYFDMYPDRVWRHGDWIKITERGTLIIYGRSDSTLNRHGIRIGTSEIYRTLDKIPEIADSLIVNLELAEGGHFMPLFVKLKDQISLKEPLKEVIRKALRRDCSPRHVPDDVIAVPDIPYTLSGKKLETPIKKILMGIPVEKAANTGAMRNPESLEFYILYRAQLPGLNAN